MVHSPTLAPLSLLWLRCPSPPSLHCSPIEVVLGRGYGVASCQAIDTAQMQLGGRSAEEGGGKGERREERGERREERG